MVIFNRFFLIISFLSAMGATQAQQSKSTGWSAIVNTIRIGKKSQLIMDAQVRSADHWSKAETFIMRPGISYSINAKTAISIGIALVSNRRTVSGITDFVSDNRLWQQFLTNQQLGQNPLQHRIRLEERMAPTIYAVGAELKKRDPHFNARLRYFNRYASSFHKGVSLTKGPYWVIQNEFFFNTAGLQYVNRKLLDQTRTYVGTGWRISAKADVELGYMLQHIVGVGKAYTNNHILQLTSFLRL